MLFSPSGFVSAKMQRKYFALKLAFFWIIGLFCGWELFQISGVSSGTLVRDSLVSYGSTGSLIIRILAPFLICMMGVLLEQRWLIYGCCFGKSVLLVFASLCTMASFGSGGWLIRFLFLFTDTVMCVLWYGFGLYCLYTADIFTEKTLLFCSAGLALAAFDLRVISPLLERILIY